MRVDVVVPARRDVIDRLLYSLSKQTRLPDSVIVVTNEVTPQPVDGLDIEVVRFWSDHYAVGHHDVVLRRNIGVCESEADLIIFQDDDQIASPTMVEDCIEKTQTEPFVWGHHRYLDFDGKTWDEIMSMPPEAGRSRESAPNREHGWQSCYAGMMASRRDFLIDVGLFDMMFMGNHAGEDQQLGRRMLAKVRRYRSFIAEPPFAWHPKEAGREYVMGPTNLCSSEHQLAPMWYNGMQFIRCAKCPFQVAYWSGPTEDNRVVIPYEHSRVQLKKESI